MGSFRLAFRGPSEFLAGCLVEAHDCTSKDAPHDEVPETVLIIFGHGPPSNHGGCMQHWSTEALDEERPPRASRGGLSSPADDALEKVVLSRIES
jgi:hypothetical protein